jgi:hypothetical protein
MKIRANVLRISTTVHIIGANSGLLGGCIFKNFIDIIALCL